MAYSIETRNMAELAYNAYSEAAGGVSLATGDTLPSWDDLSHEIKNAWCVTVIAVTRAANQQEIL